MWTPTCSDKARCWRRHVQLARAVDGSEKLACRALLNYPHRRTSRAGAYGQEVVSGVPRVLEQCGLLRGLSFAPGPCGHAVAGTRR